MRVLIIRPSDLIVSARLEKALSGLVPEIEFFFGTRARNLNRDRESCVSLMSTGQNTNGDGPYLMCLVYNVTAGCTAY